MKKLRVAVLLGGISAEREISLNSGKKVIKALKKSGKYEVKTYDPKTDLKKLIEDKDKLDVALPILHGSYGEDGTIQGFLELLKIPYAFSGVLASSLAMNKLISRRIFESVGLPVPRYISIKKSDSDRENKISQFTNHHLKSGVVVKPNTQGSSIGITICKDEKELKKGLKVAFKYDDEVLIEEYIEGLEITGGVLGDAKSPKSLPIIEIVPKNKFFDLQAKYNGSTAEIVPARISKKITLLAQNYAKKAHQALGCSGVTRTDMIMKTQNSPPQIGGSAEEAEKIKNQKEQIYVLEINTIPGFTEESLLPKAAKAAGISFPALLDRLIELALNREGHRVSKKT